MVADAISKGATRIVLGLGGSATNDAGLGALQALGLDIYSMNGALLEQPLSGGMMTEISRLDFTALNEKLLGVSIILHRRARSRRDILAAERRFPRRYGDSRSRDGECCGADRGISRPGCT